MRDVASSSIEAGVKVVSGRLHVANNYGSELLTVPVVVHAQYWNGTRFVNSTTDQKTSFSHLDVMRRNCKKKMAEKCMGLSITAPKSPLMVDGAISLTMAAPGAGNTGSVDLNINGFDWLPSTTARIGLGIYKAGSVIYMREAY
jgi:MSHA biogenesis protein MshQ